MMIFFSCIRLDIHNERMNTKKPELFFYKQIVRKSTMCVICGRAKKNYFIKILCADR